MWIGGHRSRTAMASLRPFMDPGIWISVGEHDGDVQSGFEYRDRFICVRCFHDLKSAFLDHLGGVHSNEELILHNKHHGSLGRRVLHFVSPSRNLTQRRLNVIVP
jgi:hypothetical protein